MKTLHNSGRYSAHLHPTAGLIVEIKRYKGEFSTDRKTGVRLPPTHPQFASYVEAITSAIDGHEADALCKALIY